MARPRKDLATVSFHFLQREKTLRGKQVVEPFTPGEFNSLCDNVRDQPWPDLDAEETLERVRFGTLVPFRNFERVNSRTARGTFQTSYSGHAYHNSEKGKIEARSLNQREFQYLLYLSDEGQIFIGAQYLGNYGGYDALRWGLSRHLPSRAGVRSYSFRKEVYDPSLVKPKEIRINIASTGREDEDNVLTKKRMVVLQRNTADDEDFEDAARDNFFPIMSSDAADKKGQLIKLLSANNIMSADDEDVKNCVILVDINGREKRLHVLGDSNFATRFPLEVPYNLDGHPEFDPTTQAIMKTLKREIISAIS